MFSVVVERVVIGVRVVVRLGGLEVKPGKASEEYGSVAERKNVPLDCLGPKLATIFSSGSGELCINWEEVSCYAKSFF